MTVQLKIYDVLGREVAILINEVRPAGSHAAEFDAAMLPSGVYYYQLLAGKYSQSKKILLIR